jgi:hypothetical protein
LPKKLKITQDLLELALVEVEWVDATCRTSWASADEVTSDSHQTTPCRTSGYLLTHTKKDIRVGATINGLGGIGDVTTIPAPWIVKINYLRKGKVLK